MINAIQPIYKSKEDIQFGWNPEPGAVSYKIYVGLGPVLNVTPLVTGIANVLDNVPATQHLVTCTVQIADVRTLLGLPATVDFSNKLFYFAITFVNSANVESPLASSIVVEVPPVGITVRTMRDDPTINRHDYVFSGSLQKWVKMAGSSSGAIVTDTADFYKSNMTTLFTYDGTNLKTIKSYPSDATLAGMPAKLTTYTYSGSQVIKIQVTDSTV